jgi:hypothetical protein
MDDATGPTSAANAIFRIFSGATEIYTSPAMTATSPSIFVDISVAGLTEIRLVTDPNGGDGSDWGDWADAKLLLPPDVTGPARTLSAASFSTAPVGAYTFQVVYADIAHVVNRSTLGNDDIRVTGPGGFSQLATLVSTVPPSGDALTITATYSITAPGGTWDASDNGTYTVSLEGAVSDNAGNNATTGTLGTFVASIGGLDPDASAWLTAIEAADGAALPAGARTAYNDLVVGLKADGNFTTLNAAVMLCGARTLTGCLIP